MDVGAILVLLALLLTVGLFLAAPLTRGAHPPPLGDSPEVSGLLAERDRVIHALQELDFDFKLGKVPEDAYPEQRASLVKRGAAILQRLDTLPSAASSAAPRAGDAVARIEQAAAVSSPGDSTADAVLADERIESMLAARRAARRGKSAGFCPRCGKPILVSDQFCPNCGKSLQ